MSMVDWVSIIIFIVVVVGGLYGAYNHGWHEGRHRERMHLLDILNRIPHVPELIFGSQSKYNHMYIVEYIVRKMKEN